MDRRSGTRCTLNRILINYREGTHSPGESTASKRNKYSYKTLATLQYFFEATICPTYSWNVAPKTRWDVGVSVGIHK